MKIKLEQITQIEYEQLDYPVLFNEDGYQRHFALLTSDDYSFKFTWSSFEILPIITEVTPKVYSVGIDTNFALVNFESKTIVLKIELHNYFYDVIINNGFLYMIAQLKIIKIDTINFNIVQVFGLPDFFEEMAFEEGKIKISCIGGIVVEYEDLYG